MRIARPDGGVLALMTMSMACDLTTFVIPLIVDTLVTRHHMPDTQVGFVMTAQMLSCAALSFALVPRVRGLNPRAAIMLGLVLVAVGNGLTAVAYHAPLLYAARIAAGLGEALVNVVVGVSIAHRRDPDRGFAMISIGITSGAVAVFVAAPLVATWFGRDAIFWILAVLPALALLCVRGVPTGRLDQGERTGAAAGAPFVLTAPAAALLVSLVGFGIAGNAIFTFIERIADGLRISYADFHSIMLWSTAATAAGPVAARLIGLRFGRLPILAFGFIGVGLCGPIVADPQSPAMLFAVLNVGGFCIMIAQPYYQGLLATMDPSGRLITLSRGVLTIGMAITPSIASLMLLGGGGFPAMGLWSLVIAFASLAGVVYAARASSGKPALTAAPLLPAD